MVSVIIGLGNVGPEYVGTRHNVGFDVIKLAAKRRQLSGSASGNSFVSVLDHAYDDPTVYALPTTLMNRSGQAVVEVLERYGRSLDDVLVVTDDFNLPLGRLRLRQRGSDGGHNGLADIIETLGTDEFARLRVGIGEPPNRDAIVPYVLGRFTPAETGIVSRAIDTAADACILAPQQEIAVLMAHTNRPPASAADAEPEAD